MHAFIDTSTGTWGAAEDIVFLYLDPEQTEALEGMSNEEICAFGNAHGDAPLDTSGM